MPEKEYSLGLYEKALPSVFSWQQKLETAKKYGFDFIEISIDESDEKLARLDIGKSERLFLIDIMNVVGIPVRSLCLSGHRKYPLGSSDPETERRGMEIMTRAITFADDLGIRLIMLAGYDVYYEKSDDSTKLRFEKNLRECVEMAAAKGVVLAFETMETPFMNTVTKAMTYVNLIDSAYLQVYPDIGNITNAAVTEHSDVLADLRACKGKIVAMHLKETVPGKFRNMMFGEGDVDFESAIDVAWNMGVRRYTTEFWYLDNPDWEKNIRFAHDFFTAILDRRQRRTVQSIS